MFFADEAEKCRSQALAYIGKPEAPFLLRVARAFDQLDKSAVDMPVPRQRGEAPADFPVAL